jgi:hypothetical protein
LGTSAQACTQTGGYDLPEQLQAVSHLTEREIVNRLVTTLYLFCILHQQVVEH